MQTWRSFMHVLEHHTIPCVSIVRPMNTSTNLCVIAPKTPFPRAMRTEQTTTRRRAVYELEGLRVVEASIMIGEKHGCVFCGE